MGTDKDKSSFPDRSGAMRDAASKGNVEQKLEWARRKRAEVLARREDGPAKERLKPWEQDPVPQIPQDDGPPRAPFREPPVTREAPRGSASDATGSGTQAALDREWQALEEEGALEAEDYPLPQDMDAPESYPAFEDMLEPEDFPLGSDDVMAEGNPSTIEAQAGAGDPEPEDLPLWQDDLTGSKASSRSSNDAAAEAHEADAPPDDRTVTPVPAFLVRRPTRSETPETAEPDVTEAAAPDEPRPVPPRSRVVRGPEAPRLDQPRTSAPAQAGPNMARSRRSRGARFLRALGTIAISILLGIALGFAVTSGPDLISALWPAPDVPAATTAGTD